jgi:hypothetical protein
MSRLQELEAHLARLEGQAAPQPQQALEDTREGHTMPAVDIAPLMNSPRWKTWDPASRQEALRLWQDKDTSDEDRAQMLQHLDSWATASAPAPSQQAPAAQPPAEEPITPERRFLDLPSVQALPLEERTQRFKEFYGLGPDLKEEFLRSEEPPSDLTVDIEKPSPTAPRTPEERQARIREELAAWERQAGRPWREGDPRMPSEKRLGVPDEAPVTESLTAPSTMIPLLMPGAGLKLAAGPIKALPSLLQRGARPVVEGLSQTAGWTAGRTAETGEVPSPGEIGKEAALNVATGGVVEIPAALRSAKNAVLRSTPGAQILLNQRAVQEAEGLGKRVFNAQDKEVVGKAFDSVSATGEKLDVTPVRDLWNSLTLAERRIAGAELTKISSTFADALKTRKLGDWDIGELQHLRSELRTAGLGKRTPETQDLLQSLRSAVDEAIHNGMAKGSLPAAELIEAQKAYRKVMQAEDLQGLITKHTRDSPNLKWQELNLAALNKELRGGGTKAARNLTNGMDATEKQRLMQELDSLKRHYPFISMPRQGATMAGTSAALAATGLALTGNLPAAAAVAVPAILAAAARSPNVMSLFKRSIIEGKGRLAQHHVDALLNAIRHENEGQAPMHQSPPAQEGRRPVDIAPMMDHPHWKTLTTAQRKEALRLWQDPATSESDRAEMRQIMDRWQSEAVPGVR